MGQIQTEHLHWRQRLRLQSGESSPACITLRQTHMRIITACLSLGYPNLHIRGSLSARLMVEDCLRRPSCGYEWRTAAQPSSSGGCRWDCTVAVVSAWLALRAEMDECMYVWPTRPAATEERRPAGPQGRIVGLLSIDARVTSTFKMNLLTGRVEEHRCGE